MKRIALIVILLLSASSQAHALSENQRLVVQQYKSWVTNDTVDERLSKMTFEERVAVTPVAHVAKVIEYANVVLIPDIDATIVAHQNNITQLQKRKVQVEAALTEWGS